MVFALQMEIIWDLSSHLLYVKCRISHGNWSHDDDSSTWPINYTCFMDSLILGFCNVMHFAYYYLFRIYMQNVKNIIKCYSQTSYHQKYHSLNTGVDLSIWNNGAFTNWMVWNKSFNKWIVWNYAWWKCNFFLFLFIFKIFPIKNINSINKS